MDQFSPTKPSDRSPGFSKINNFHAPKSLLQSPKGSHTLKPFDDKSTSHPKSPSFIEIVEVSIPFPEAARILSPKNSFTPRTVIGRSPRNTLPVFSPREEEPPVNLEPVFNTKVDRPDTLKIFTQKMDAVREMEDLQKKSEGKTGEKTKTNSQQMVIKRGDSVRTIKAVVENGKKQLNKKTKEKLKGSMYVNELWGNSYENEVMRATSLDKVIKLKEDKSRKPYFEKLREMAQNFENRPKEEETLPPVWTSTQKKFSVQLDLSDASSPFDYYSATLRTEPNQETSTSPGGNENARKHGKSKLSIFSRAPFGRFNLPSEPSEDDSSNMVRIRMNSCPDAHDIINSALESRTPIANGELVNDFSSSIAKQEMVPVFRGNNLTLSSKLAETSRRASLAASPRSDSGKLPEMKPRKSKFTLNLDFSAAISARAIPASGTEIQNKLMKIPGLHNGIAPRRQVVKQNLKSENQEKFESLIEKCQTELDDKKNYKGMIHELKGLFVKKRGYLKEQVMKQKKESSVDQCRFFLKKTQQK